MNIPIWTGSSLFISGSGQTPFGFYDGDSAFVGEADKVAKWCAIRLGYPIVDVELQDNNFYSAFEEAVNVYGNEVHQWKVRENYLSMEGNSTGSSFNQQVITPSLGTLIRIAKTYGAEAGSGGTVTYYTGSIPVTESVQSYDLNAWATTQGISGGIEIKRVLHEAPSAMQRYFDPYAGLGSTAGNTFEAFGMGNASPGVSFMMMPVNADVLRIQAIEFNDQIRRSAYSFDLVNNQLRVFPIPTFDAQIWFHYIKVDERDDITNNNKAGQDNLITNISNVPYQNPVYRYINPMGKQWIYQYALAISKEMLGYIRKKYQSIPIPGSEVTLNGDDLITAATAEKAALLEQLRLTLEETSRKAQLERQSNESNFMRDQLTNVPLAIYVF